MWDELQNALAWYRAAPQRWIASAQQELSAAAQWIWEVIQGDFNEEQSTAQVVTGTVISMIPFVELCDVRDLVANCRKIHEDKSNKWAWLALVLTLIGLFPTLGSLAKGCLKIPFSYGRRAALRSAATAFDSDIWKATRDALKSKDEWRRRFAVWTSWNRNGEYVTYAVPLGKPLRGWEGVTASQRMKGSEYVLEGGARQIVFDPKDLDKAFVSKRQTTGCSYGDSGESIGMLGVPVLKNNWKE